MSQELLGLLFMIGMMGLIFIGIPVCYSMILTGVVGLFMVYGWGGALGTATLVFTTYLSSYTMAVLPVFLVMGEFANVSDMMTDAYRATSKWLGNLPGGLAIASVLGAAIFSAVSGSSMVCAAVMARIALPELFKYKYKPILATGAINAGGTLGNLIPPGTILIFYAMITEESLGKLFVACIVPGILLTLMYSIQIYLTCLIHPTWGPPTGPSTWREKAAVTPNVLPIFVTFLLVIGGIYAGIYTPNEAASFGTMFVFFWMLLKRKVNGQTMGQSFRNTIGICGMSFAIVTGAQVFAIYIALSGMSQMVAQFLLNMNLSALWLIIGICFVYFLLGIALGPLTMLLLTIPVYMPILAAYNINLIWFGVLFIVQAELASLSPPVGLNLFVTAAIAKPFGVTMNTVFLGALPFCVTMLVFNVLLIVFPDIVMFLVNRMTI